MRKSHSKIQTCVTCGRATNDAYLCRRCSHECRDLLVGSHEPDGQPGIIWYIRRLRESAYGQTRLGRSLASRSAVVGYALLGNRQAADLLTRIGGKLALWEAIVEGLCATHSHETDLAHMGSLTRDSERLEARRARFIAAHVVLVRHHYPDAGKLHADMLAFAREAWRIINRPNDICCGPCPTMIKEKPNEDEKPCGTLLYAEDGANTVPCPHCHTGHHVDTLRDNLKASVTDMLFTRAELVNLMETRLNDRIPQPTFTKLLRDGRLQPRKYEDDVPMFTYDDVVAARGKPVPHRRAS